MKKFHACLMLCFLTLVGCSEDETPEDDDSSSTSTGIAGEGGGVEGGSDEGGAGGEAGATSSVGGAGGGDAVCTPAEKQCVGLDVETCNDAGTEWELTATCPFLCDEGACTGVCSPGSNQCDGDNVQTCNTEGQWETTSSCTFVCDDGACDGECVPGAGQCDGLTPQLCSDEGVWVYGLDCQFTCSQGACAGACTPNDDQCNGNTVQTCDDSGQWQNTTVCPFVCLADACAGSCVPGAQQCLGDAPQTCSAAGQWVTGSACPFLCAGGACTGVCEPGTKKCAGTSTQLCTASGQWEAPVVCPSPANTDPTCSGNGVCGWGCDAGFDNCDGQPANGCEANLASPDTCGSCNNECSSAGGTPSCSAGSCGIACDSDHSNCNGGVSDGCEVTLGTVLNCDSCGDVCTAGPHASGVCTGSGCDYVCTGLWDDCNGNAVDGCEQDVSDDDFNCGGCGVSCYGGTCTSGVCSVPVTKVAAVTNVTSMTLGTSEVFWTTAAGQVQKSALAGGGVTNLATGQTGPEGIVTTGTQVVWSNSVTPKAIRSMSTSGGAVTDLITGHGPVELAQDGSNLYWTSRVDYSPCNCSDSSATPIYKMSLLGGAATIINPEVNSGLYPSWPGLQVDGTNVYRLTWETNAAASVIRSQNKTDTTMFGGAGGGVYVGATFENFFGGKYLVKNPNNDLVIFTNLTSSGPALVRAHDGQAPNLISVTPSLEVKGLAADNTHVYVIGRFAVSLPYRIIRFPLSGGSADYLVDNQHNASNILVDATHVYWTIEGVKPGLGAPILDPVVVRMPK